MIGKKRGLYSIEWISAESQSTEINLQAYREDWGIFDCVAETVFENFNLVKSYDKTYPNDCVFSLWKIIQVGLIFFCPVYFQLLFLVL